MLGLAFLHVKRHILVPRTLEDLGPCHRPDRDPPPTMFTPVVDVSHFKMISKSSADCIFTWQDYAARNLTDR